MASIVPGSYVPDRSVPARIARRMTQWRAAAPMPAGPRRSIITFTFDDFPKSAAQSGAEILEAAGLRATYYAATGLRGKTLGMGDMYEADDLARLQTAGHEIGSHTQSHRDCARLGLPDALADIERGDAELREAGIPHPIRQFAYPFGETTAALKDALAGRYDCCRGILPGINRKGSDRAQLRAIELGDKPGRIERALNAIRAAMDRPGWVIFYTHDVRTSPSAYGISPETFCKIVEAAKGSGARIETMGAAYASIMEHPA